MRPRTVPSAQDRGYGNVNQAAINARHPLYNKANSETIAQAEKAYEVAIADLESAEQDLIVRLALAYFDVLAAQDALATTRASKAATAEQLASAKRNFEVGTATITDTREAQSRFDLVSAQEIAGLNDLASKRAALDTLVGRTGVTPRPLLVPRDTARTAADERRRVGHRGRPATPHGAPRPPGPTRSPSSRPRRRAPPNCRRWMPWRRSRASDLRRQQVQQQWLQQHGHVGVQLNWPLFAGFAVQNRVKETLSLTDKARNELEAARRGVGQGTRVAFFGVQSGLAQVKALEAAEASTKLALEATQLGYKVGVRVNLDVLNAQRELFATQRDLAKARYDVVVGGLKLRQAAGQLAPPDVQAVNQLLAK